MHIKPVIIPFQICNGHFEYLFPEGPVSRLSFLKLMGGCQRLRPVGFILLGFRGRSRIDLFQFGNRERSFLRILFRSFRKIRQLRHAVPDFRDDKPDLETPVTQMDVAEDVISDGKRDTAYALPDHGSAQMADVKGFGNIWPAVIHDDLLRMFRFRYFHFI